MSIVSKDVNNRCFALGLLIIASCAILVLSPSAKLLLADPR